MSNQEDRNTILEELDEEDQEELDFEETNRAGLISDDQFTNQPFRVVYQTNNFFLPQIRDIIINGDTVNIRPEYQRRLRWTAKQKSLLIESLLLNVPIPPVFFYENDLARYEVMDGQQRLNAIKEFLEGDFALRGLTVLSDLNGRRYAKLPPKVKRNLDRSSISAIVLLQESQGKLRVSGSSNYYELRRFVFERLNTGGKRLNAQEIRNAVYGGEFNDLVTKLSRDKTFTKIWDIPEYTNSDPNEYYEEPERQKNYLYKSMGDCQIILRFFALENDKSISGSIRSMLDRCMERYLYISSDEAEQLKDRYLSRLNMAYELFDGRPFELAPTVRSRRRPLVGIYDGVMVALDRLWYKRSSIIRNKSTILNRYSELVKGKAHTGELTGVASTSQDIKKRISLFETIFK